MKSLALARLFSGLALLAPVAVSAEPGIAEPTPGLVTAWELSPATRASDLSAERYLDGQPPAAVTWLPIQSESSGWVDLARHRSPVAGGLSKVWAHAVVETARPESRPFVFGYNGNLSLYLNCRVLYRGRHPAPSEPPPALADAAAGHDTVYLPLEAGKNDLVLAVSGQSGAWSFIVRDLTAIYRHPSLQPAWEIAGQLNAPESVACDLARGVLYVSNFGGDSLSKIGLDGTILASPWVSGLKRPTGLKFAAGKLYAVERSGIAEIDPGRGEIVARHAIPGTAFINDLAVADNGAIYVTDTFKHCLFQLSDGKAETWLDSAALQNPNGLLVEPTRLLVGVSADGTIKAVDLATKQVSTFLTLGPGANMDGLVADGRGGYLFSDYYGRIYRADAAGRRTLLLDRRGPQQFTADFEYVPEKNLLIVPSLYDHRLTAYVYRPELP